MAGETSLISHPTKKSDAPQPGASKVRNERPGAPTPAATPKVRLGLRGRLLLWILPIVNLAFLGMWIVSTLTATQGFSEMADKNLALGAQNLASAIRNSIDDAFADALTTARLDLAPQAIESGDGKNFTWYANELIRTKSKYAAILASDKKGTIMAANSLDRKGQPLAEPLVGKSIASFTWAAAALAANPGEGVAIAPIEARLLFGGASSTARVVGFSLPVVDIVNEVIGTVTVLCALEHFTDKLAGYTRANERGVESMALLTAGAGDIAAFPTGVQGGASWNDVRLDHIAEAARVNPGSRSTETTNWSDPQGALYRAIAARVGGAAERWSWRVVTLQTEAALRVPVHAMSDRILTVFIIAVLLTTTVVFLIATKSVGPIRRLTEATSVVGRASELAEIPIETNDEVGALTRSFNRMMATIRSHEEGLENKVRTRTAELAERNQAMRLVLDNVEQGLATVDQTGQIMPGRSAAFDKWFVRAADGAPFPEVLANGDPNLVADIAMRWQAVLDDLLPMELNIHQLPKRLVFEGRHYALSYSPLVGDDGTLRRMLVIVSDMTAEVERSHAEEIERELIAVFRRAMKDPAGLVEFIATTDTAVKAIHDDSIVDDRELARTIHTVKGNVGLFGISTVASVCQRIENSMNDERRRPSVSERKLLLETWENFRARVKDLIADDRRSVIELTSDELEALIDSVETAASPADLVRRLLSLRLERAEVRLQRLAVQTRDLARRLGKGEVVVNIEANRVRLPAGIWDEFWASLVHVLRNAVDHGLESKDERIALSKPAAGMITLRTRIDGQDVLVEVNDDGRGVDWDRVAQKAAEMGLPHRTREELKQALFWQGLSTRDTATDISGRGIGLNAVKAACEKMGGTVDLRSTPGVGTVMCFRIPLTKQDLEVDAEGNVLPRGVSAKTSRQVPVASASVANNNQKPSRTGVA